MVSAATLLSAWERGGGQPPLRQALRLLEAAHPDTAPEALAQLSVGHRDGLLLDLRERAFGPHLESVATCPQCGEWLEVTLSTDDLRMPAPIPTPPLEAHLDGYAVTFRLPTTEDLLSLTEGSGGDGAPPAPEQAVLARCVEAAEHAGAPVGVAELPAQVVEALAEQMEAADPQANVTLALTCPACAHAWEALFDVGAFLWAEVEAWAQRTLREVHLLASAYGWTETEVLSLSARRRRHYLQEVHG